MAQSKPQGPEAGKTARSGRKSSADVTMPWQAAPTILSSKQKPLLSQNKGARA
jgi:hypothetical protein